MFLPNAVFEVNFLKSLVNYLGQAGDKLQKNVSREKKTKTTKPTEFYHKNIFELREVGVLNF